MKKKYYLALGLLATLASCSQDEVMEVNRSGDEITFDVVANKATRAANLYCNNALPESFYVYAMSKNVPYIVNDVINKDGNNWVNAGGTRYWPDNDVSVDFYAYTGVGTSQFSCKYDEAEKKTVTMITDFEAVSNVAEQKDLIYAVQLNESRVSNDDEGNAVDADPVSLNFRHALSQIVFDAKNVSENIYVKIAGVSVGNVQNKGDFTLPQTSTTENYVNHTTQTAGDGHTFTATGTWVLEDGLVNYNVDLASAVELKTKDKLEHLTNTVVDGGNTNALLLLPQTKAAWDPETYSNPTKDGNVNSYILVDCIIYNVADPAKGYQDGDVILWGTSEGGTKELAIPAAFNWEQGKKYIYTIVFGKGNGGYNPGGDPDPDPVLVPISFKVTVDDFVPVDGGEIVSEIESEDEGEQGGGEGDGN